MTLPQVAIVGRPNVGKSSIFNWLAGKRLAIVDDVAGVTRDRMTYLLEHQDREFEIVDTGGVGINDVDELDEEIEQQIAIAMHRADVVVFVLDIRAGATSLDDEVARRLRLLEKPVILIANKADYDGLDSQAAEFYRLGGAFAREGIILASAKQNRGREELLDAVVELLPDVSALSGEPAIMKAAIVGRRNVGKSTFINSMAEAERMIVSEVPGTTRDSVDVTFELDGKAFTAIDTPGVRKRKSMRTDIEFYGLHRAHRSIRRADVTLLFFDASQRISKIEKQLCQYIEEQFKPCIFVVNKWDLMAEHMPTQNWSDYLRDTFPSMWHAPIAFVTGQTGRNLKKLLNHAQMLYKQTLSRVSTGELNRLINTALERHPPPLHYHRRPKIYYATQTSVQPPTIVLKCNMPDAFPATYRRYLQGILRDQLEFGEVPIRLFFEKRGKEEKK